MLFIPRKNGKTHLAAGIVLLLLFCDDEQGAHIYSAAADREQARIVFEAVKQFILAEPELNKRSTIYQTHIEVEKSASHYRALSAEAKTKHGLSASGLIIDELHAHRDRELVDTLMTSVGSRRQPLVLHLTTAGHDRFSICYEKYDYARKVAAGVIPDRYFLPVIYEAPEDSQWDSEKTWRIANPNLGVSLSLDYLTREAERAKATPAYEQTFRQLHLNQWVQSTNHWLDLATWDQCYDEEEPNLRGMTCYAGLDLSATIDLSALTLIFPMQDNKTWIKTFCWCPEENAQKREHRDRVPYLTWARQGWLEMTPGNCVDYEFLKRRLAEIHKTYRVKAIGVDRWNASQLVQEMVTEGYNVKFFGQGFKSMSWPSKDLEGLLADRRLKHDGNPLLRWAISNCGVDMDPAGNIKPSKSKSTDRIDPLVALVIALGVSQADAEPGQYQGGGIWL